MQFVGGQTIASQTTFPRWQLGEFILYLADHNIISTILILYSADHNIISIILILYSDHFHYYQHNRAHGPDHLVKRILRLKSCGKRIRNLD